MAEMNNIKNLKYLIPAENLGVFVYPLLHGMQELLTANMAKINQYDLKIHGLDINFLRDKIRFEIIEAATEYTNALLLNNREPDGNDNVISRGSYKLETTPIFQTGHAPIFYPPGIWIKNHLVDFLAKNYNGIGINVVMDNDTPAEDFVQFPNLTTEHVSVKSIKGIDIPKGLAFEETNYCSIRTDRDIKALYCEINDKFSSAINDSKAQDTIRKYIDLLNESLKLTENLGESLTFARRRFEVDYGLQNLEIPISKICETEGFLIFFLALASESDRFANVYNSKLGKYRKENNIRSIANPLPNLKVNEGLIELPFWIWKENSLRKKVYARKTGNNHVDILLDNTEFSDSQKTDKSKTEGIIHFQTIKIGDFKQNLKTLKDMANAGFKIRPKALANTMFLRLFFADVFVHGIGGAKYDIVTNCIIEDFFCVSPPDYVVVSATLFPPVEKLDVDNSSLQKIENDLKQMKHNPDKHLTEKQLKNKNIKGLILEKKRLIEDNPKGGNDSKKKFLRLKEINAKLSAHIKHEFTKKESERNILKNKLNYNSVINNRNYPIFIYPEEFLKKFYKNAFSLE